jgi:hypothetical protein
MDTSRYFRPLGMLCLSSAMLYAAEGLRADTLKITSEPPGATVEIDGSAVGKTPYEQKIPSGYLHRPSSVLSSRLEKPMRARITLHGYLIEDLDLTGDRSPWVSLKGSIHGYYYLLKADHFHFVLRKAANKLNDSDSTAAANGKEKSSTDAPAATGQIDLESDPADAEVFVDGGLVGTAPMTLTLQAGAHTLRVTHSGSKDWEKQITVLANNHSHLKLHLEPAQ